MSGALNGDDIVSTESRSQCVFAILKASFPATQAHRHSFTLSTSRDPTDGPSASVALTHKRSGPLSAEDDNSFHAPSPPLSEASSSSPPSPRPPPFSSLYSGEPDSYSNFVSEAEPSSSLTRPLAPPPFSPSSAVVAETKAALPPDHKGGPSNKSADEGEPPPPYTEGSSPLNSFTYLMAAAGGATSIITQVQQGGPPINTLGGTFHKQIMSYHGDTPYRLLLDRTGKEHS
ncbi:hypothetical protein GP486_004511 [Trichoglossum hirsutum]|uniref:Uncharacterized protein n=1 Tax=Trichoglossum hirsutum TaxID=265104 RepID=A0A9P8LB90_9PEZI|nr:hypothetical protein GP486_004511 [Trichoglossum hirsutum]